MADLTTASQPLSRSRRAPRGRARPSTSDRATARRRWWLAAATVVVAGATLSCAGNDQGAAPQSTTSEESGAAGPVDLGGSPGSTSLTSSAYSTMIWCVTRQRIDWDAPPLDVLATYEDQTGECDKLVRDHPSLGTLLVLGGVGLGMNPDERIMHPAQVVKTLRDSGVDRIDDVVYAIDGRGCLNYSEPGTSMIYVRFQRGGLEPLGAKVRAFLDEAGRRSGTRPVRVGDATILTVPDASKPCHLSVMVGPDEVVLAVSDDPFDQALVAEARSRGSAG